MQGPVARPCVPSTGADALPAAARAAPQEKLQRRISSVQVKVLNEPRAGGLLLAALSSKRRA